jgi:HPt (histidine-containing phosphotransfer) domain-containing protein
MVDLVTDARTAIDWKVLDRVCAEDSALLVRLLDAFLEDGAKDAADLRRVLESGDLAETSRVAHRIYGAAKTIGAGELARLSHALDAACLAGQAGRVAELAPRVRAHFAAVTELIVAQRRCIG